MACCAQLVARITADPGLRRVDELADASGMTARSLQRLFADYVGVSPKWVMRRARLHYAAGPEEAGATGLGGWWVHVGLGLYYHGDDHGAAAVVVADPLAYYAAG